MMNFSCTARRLLPLASLALASLVVSIQGCQTQDGPAGSAAAQSAGSANVGSSAGSAAQAGASSTSGGTSPTASGGSGVGGAAANASGGASGASGGAGGSACAATQTLCSGACVETASDPAHCGACASACSTGQACTSGSCQCQSGLTSCDGACVDLASDVDDCGSCGTSCANGSVCSSGTCGMACASGQTACNRSCVTLTSDVANCGACGTACPAGQTCGQGQCQCPSGQTLCNGACVDTATNATNCGACSKACASGQSCQSSQCACPSGQTLCNDSCVDTATSAANCGACGKACASGETCAASACSGGSSATKVFSQCRFHFGAIDTFATQNNLAAQLDYFTPGWMGTSDTFDQSAVCTEAKGALANQVPVIVAYVAAFYAKRHDGLCDCNVTTCGTNNDLCHNGSAYIQQNLSSILAVYKSYAQGYASCYGTTKPIVFEMEPDFYQYTNSSESSPWTGATAASIMKQFVTTIKAVLPNAVFSMDISPWVAPNNGADNGATWYGNFDMTQFTFINTSGGSTDATSTKIRSSNSMTWAGVSTATGKPILADTGYGVNGSSAGPDPNWDNVTNINARMKDGVVGVCQYNPSSSWATTISGNRSQLGTPKFCP